MFDKLVNWIHAPNDSALSAAVKPAICIEPYTPDMDGMGDRIKAARESFPDMSQADLAEMVGVTRGAVSQWELGNVSKITALNLHRLSIALRKDYVFLLTGKARALQEGEMDFDEIELLSLYRTMTDVGREAARKQVAELSKLFRAPGKTYKNQEERLIAGNKGPKSPKPEKH